MNPHSSLTGNAKTIVGRGDACSAGDDRDNARDHRRHRTFVVASPATVDPAIAHFAAKWVHRHAIHRDGILMHVPKLQLAALAGRRTARHDGDQILASRMHFLPQPPPAQLLAKALQIVRQPRFAAVGVDLRPAQRIDARDADELLERFDRIERHGAPADWQRQLLVGL